MRLTAVITIDKKSSRLTTRMPAHCGWCDATERACMTNRTTEA